MTDEPSEERSDDGKVASPRKNVESLGNTEAKMKRRRSNLPARGLGETFSVRVPANHDVAYTAAEKHGPDHWKVQVLHFLHSDPVQITLMLLLILDVLILFVELFLQAQYPSCPIIVRDAISCCPTEASESQADIEHDTSSRLRFLEGDSGHGGGEDEHHNLCVSPSLESFSFEATCDPHKWGSVHMTENVLFGFTISILSIFMVELTIMAMILQCAFFRQFFYVLDLFIITVSLTLEITFHILHRANLTSLAGMLVLFRVWRFVRIGHGLIEVAAEYAHRDKEALMDYAEQLEDILHENNIGLPETNKKIQQLKKQLEAAQEFSGHTRNPPPPNHNYTSHSSNGDNKDSATLNEKTGAK